MFALQRQQKIMELLYSNKSVDVSVLSSLFNVSEMTIRRDLSKLENDGCLKKTYGGAVLRDESEDELPRDETVNLSGMVMLAVALIEDGDSVFIGSGPSSRELAHALKGRSLIVVTNDLFVASELSDSPGMRVFIVGSELRFGTGMLTGSVSTEMLGSLSISTSFISVGGTDLRTGFTLSSFEECRLVGEILKVTRKAVFLAKSAGFDRPSFARLAGLETPQAVITDDDIPPRYKTFLFDHGVSLYTPFELK